MSHINVTINGRQYRMACEEGQEVRLLKLAESLETRIQSLRGKFGEIGDARLTVMAALTVCDELVDVGNRVRSMEQELTELRDFRNAAVERARMTQTAVVNALNAEGVAWAGASPWTPMAVRRDARRGPGGPGAAARSRRGRPAPAARAPRRPPSARRRPAAP